MNKYIEISPEVQKAIDENKPIVALESTIISHGMPYPKNVETALNAQNVVRENGAVPATIAIINGKLKVGLTDEEIDYFGKKGREITKVSRRDIPYIVATKQDGATTVSATMLIANYANIKIFATGGIGGVHRGAELTFDISCDLEELGKARERGDLSQETYWEELKRRKILSAEFTAEREKKRLLDDIPTDEVDLSEDEAPTTEEKDIEK